MFAGLTLSEDKEKSVKEKKPEVDEDDFDDKDKERCVKEKKEEGDEDNLDDSLLDNNKI